MISGTRKDRQPAPPAPPVQQSGGSQPGLAPAQPAAADYQAQSIQLLRSINSKLNFMAWVLALSLLVGFIAGFLR